MGSRHQINAKNNIPLTIEVDSHEIKINANINGKIGYFFLKNIFPMSVGLYFCLIIASYQTGLAQSLISSPNFLHPADFIANILVDEYTTDFFFINTILHLIFHLIMLYSIFLITRQLSNWYNIRGESSYQLNIKEDYNKTEIVSSDGIFRYNIRMEDFFGISRRKVTESDVEAFGRSDHTVKWYYMILLSNMRYYPLINNIPFSKRGYKKFEEILLLHPRIKRNYNTEQLDFGSNYTPTLITEMAIEQIPRNDGHTELDSSLDHFVEEFYEKANKDFPVKIMGFIYLMLTSFALALVLGLYTGDDLFLSSFTTDTKIGNIIILIQTFVLIYFPLSIINVITSYRKLGIFSYFV